MQNLEFNSHATTPPPQRHIQHLLRDIAGQAQLARNKRMWLLAGMVIIPLIGFLTMVVIKLQGQLGLTSSINQQLDQEYRSVVATSSEEKKALQNKIKALSAELRSSLVQVPNETEILDNKIRLLVTRQNRLAEQQNRFNEILYRLENNPFLSTGQTNNHSSFLQKKQNKILPKRNAYNHNRTSPHDDYAQLDIITGSISETKKQQHYNTDKLVNLLGRQNLAFGEFLNRINKFASPKNKNIGGPFIPYNEPPYNASQLSLDDKHTHLEEQLETFSQLCARLWEMPIRLPVANSQITSHYGMRLDPFRARRAMHSGTDFRAIPGTPIHATAPGKVIFAGRSGGYGKVIEIEHTHGLITRYAHLKRTLVKRGEKVAPGQIIGQSGNSGRSTGPHLHYEIRANGKSINPAIFFNHKLNEALLALKNLPDSADG